MFILNATIPKISKLQNMNTYPYKKLNPNPIQAIHIETKQKKVSFDYIIDVVLIPNITDFKERDMLNYLWWNEENLVYFKNSAREEILEFMEKHKGLTIKDACNILYQPEKMYEQKIYKQNENEFLCFLW